ncbi:unnamed protein product [Fusarium graminearum]|uniref:Uncharacterized protein n=1 Tax=Gibberella zeae TaxID=5518 RepID=A0A4U9FCM4_GIBZA|nr:unnamed protein product [Fusarium graminearum]CAF3548347.1 unnamed protein product [Fusarium graminearum]CAG1970556.1 unnamed protein product [Fusarium graminearum]CAG1972021.1 unnamed protein product [Fusarium graminearum]CAG1979040.1 unnamed protein product [Fusarium graminearum]
MIREAGVEPPFIDSTALIYRDAKGRTARKCKYLRIGFPTTDTDVILSQQPNISHESFTVNLNIPKLKEGHELKSWQETGARKLADSCNFLLSGLVIGGETGLDKSLMALAANLHQLD